MGGTRLKKGRVTPAAKPHRKFDGILDELRALAKEADAESEAMLTLTNIRRGLLEQQIKKRQRWLDYSRCRYPDRLPSRDAMSRVLAFCGLSEARELNRVQRRTVEAFQGKKLSSKNLIDRRALKLKADIEAQDTKQFSKPTRRGRPMGTGGMAQPNRRVQAGAIWLDVHLTAQEVIEVLVPAIEAHVGARIGPADRTKRSGPYKALWKGLLLFAPGRRTSSISRELAKYFSSRAASAS